MILFSNRFLYFLVVSLITISSFSQSIEIPKNVSLKKYSDFRKIESKTIKIIDWLMSEKSFTNMSKRKQADNFLDTFVKLHPYVSYTPNKSLVKFKRNSEYENQFKYAWLNFVLNFEYSKNQEMNHRIGLRHVIKFYNSYKDKFGKNSYTEKIKKLQENKKLTEFIKSKI